MAIDVEKISKMTSELSSKISELKKELATSTQNLFKEGVSEFFEVTPEIKVIAWRQYTPYFNDGDTCYFSVHAPSFFKDEEMMDEEMMDELYDGDGYNPYQKPSDWTYKEAEKKGIYSAYSQAAIDAYEAQVKILGQERIDEVNENIDAMRKIFKLIPEDCLEIMFGDHSQITVTPEGITVDEYSHD